MRREASWQAPGDWLSVEGLTAVQEGSDELVGKTLEQLVEPASPWVADFTLISEGSRDAMWSELCAKWEGLLLLRGTADALWRPCKHKCTQFNKHTVTIENWHQVVLVSFQTAGKLRKGKERLRKAGQDKCSVTDTAAGTVPYGKRLA